MTRRAILEGVASAGALWCGAGTLLSETGRAENVPARTRIDVHHHFFPPALVKELERANQSLGAAAGWMPAKSLEDMDRAGVAVAILSITTPGVSFVDPALARRLARQCNEYAARMAADHSKRFGSFAVLPWPDTDASLREIEYSLDTLKADGIGMLTSYGAKWLGDPAFAPVLAELNRRKAVLYSHPASPLCCRNGVPGIPDPAIEYGTDTTRAIARIVFSGSSRKYPDIRFIFSHAGGTMPFLVERMVNLAKTPQYAAQLPNGYLAEATRFYYDTAQSSNPAAMSALRKVVPVSRILFGTDYPYRSSLDDVSGLQNCGVFNIQEQRAIERDNSLRLLPRRRV